MNDPYLTWVHHHATMFGLSGEVVLEMLIEWAKLFRLSGYSPEELTQATDWLAMHGDRNLFPVAQMQALRDRVAGQRAVENPPPSADDARGVCADCGGTGQVSVPDPRVLARWPDVTGGTCAVLCHCPLGLWMQQRNKPVQMTLVQYEADHCSYWRDLLEQKAAFLKQRQKVTLAGPHWDATLKRVLQGARERAGTNGTNGEEKSA